MSNSENRIPFRTEKITELNNQPNLTQPQPPPIPPRHLVDRVNTSNINFPYRSNVGYNSYNYNAYGNRFNSSPGLYSNGMYNTPLYNNLNNNFYQNTNFNSQDRFGQDLADGFQNNIFKQAEENSRQAFQSIESFVQAFGSISMMLESTLQALYNSFHAVIGVADHFNRLKLHFANIFSTIAFIKAVRWVYKKLLSLLPIKNFKKYKENEVWHKIVEKETQYIGELGLPKPNDIKFKSTNWPILIFFGVIVSTPWFIWQFIKSFSEENVENEWYNGNDDYFSAIVNYDFFGQSDDELIVKKNQTIRVAPKECQPRIKGWILASSNNKKGLIPFNYIKIIERCKGQKYKETTASTGT